MFPKGGVFNELSDMDCAVWCCLAPGIDPAKWAGLCRFLANLSAREFRAISARLDVPHTSLKSPQHSTGRKLPTFDTEQADTVPLVSVGPSGVGGEYQREI